MKKTFNLRKTFTILFLLFTTLACFVLSLNAYTGNAAATVETAEITMEPGAQVRLAGLIDGRIGIRWQLKMSASEYNDIEDDNVSYGILIAPNDYGALNEETVFAEDGAFWWKDINGVAQNKTENKKQIWNLETDKLTEKDGIAYFYGSLVDINPVNIAREFNAVGYMKYIAGGETKYKFASENDTVRSMTCVALRYLESGANEFTPEEEEAFRAQYVKEKEVSVVFNFNGVDDVRDITLAVSETYTANDLAKIAGIGLSGLVSSVDSLSSVKVTDDMSSITNVKFESVASKDLAGTYALAENKTLQLEFDGTASVVEGDKITNGKWRMTFDCELHSSVAMIAMDTADNSFIAQIEKTADAYALVNGDATYAQTESGIKTLEAELLGKYTIASNIYGYDTASNKPYCKTVEIRSDNQIVAGNDLGTFTCTPITNTFGTISNTNTSKGQGFYTKLDGEYYLYMNSPDNSLKHYTQYYKTVEYDTTSIREKLAGEYYLERNNKITNFKFYDDPGYNSTASFVMGNAMLISAGSKYTSGRVVEGELISASVTIIPSSNNTGYLRIDNGAGTAEDIFGFIEYFITDEEVVLGFSSANYGLVVMKCNDSPVTSTVNVDYLNAINSMLVGSYISTNGMNLIFKDDGKVLFNGTEFDYTIYPSRQFDLVVDTSKSIYKGNISIDMGGNGEDETWIVYDFSSGKTVLTANDNGVVFDALKIG